MRISLSENSRDTWVRRSENVEVGHTFIGISQASQTRLPGYYPANGVTPTDPSDSRAIINDSGHAYDVKGFKIFL